MNAIIFAENTISVMGGWFYVAKSQGKLPAVTSVQTEIDFGTVMTPNDFIVIRAHDTSGAIKAEYMKIVSLISGTNYTVIRDVASAHGTNPAWADGTPYVVLGHDGTGRIELRAGGGSGDTRISLFQQGSLYNEQTELLRVGDLNGNWGYTAEKFGVGIGQYASGKASITIEPTNGIRMFSGSDVVGQWQNDGTIVVGKVAANQANVVISSGALSLRVNTTANITLNTDGSATFAGNIASTATITGGTIQTSTSDNNRIELNGGDNAIYLYTNNGSTSLKGVKISSDNALYNTFNINSIGSNVEGQPILNIFGLTLKPNPYTGQYQEIIFGDPIIFYYARRISSNPAWGYFYGGLAIGYGDEGSGITFGSSEDTNLYRSAANTLKTDDSFSVTGTLFTNRGNWSSSTSGTVIASGTYSTWQKFKIHAIANISGTCQVFEGIFATNNSVSQTRLEELSDSGGDFTLSISSGNVILTTGNTCDCYWSVLRVV
jgi:hypothetical protein